MRIAISILSLVFLTACSSADTTGSLTKREYNIKISNSGTLFIYTPLDVQAETKASPAIDTNNNPTTRNNANASLAGQGATATGAVGEAVRQALDGVESISRQLTDNRKTNSDNTTTTTSTTNEQATQINKAEKQNTQDKNSTSDAFDLSKVIWLHTDISSWPVTSILAKVDIADSTITLNYDKASSWPGIGEKQINANPWVIVKFQGHWYAATWEWLRHGQITKAKAAVSGSHIKRKPLRDWSPKPGERLGFMVSSLARDLTHYSNVKERTDIVWTTWK